MNLWGSLMITINENENNNINYIDDKTLEDLIEKEEEVLEKQEKLFLISFIRNHVLNEYVNNQDDTFFNNISIKRFDEIVSKIYSVIVHDIDKWDYLANSIDNFIEIEIKPNDENYETK